MIRALICASILFPAAVSAQDWSYEIEPYGLVASIDGDASVGRVQGVPVAVDFSTILENLELAAMLHFEAHHVSGWGVSLDYSFIDLGADISGPRGGVLDANVRQGVLEALLVRRMETDRAQLDFLIGFRWWDNDIDLQIKPARLPGSRRADIEEDWIDLVFGVRRIAELNERWDYVLSADVGGFGLQSDFTGGLSAGFHYQMSENWKLDLRYKATWVDYESGEPQSPGFFAYDTVTHGPLIGFNYSF